MVVYLPMNLQADLQWKIIEQRGKGHHWHKLGRGHVTSDILFFFKFWLSFGPTTST